MFPAEEKSQNRMICPAPKSNSNASRIFGGDRIFLTLIESGFVGMLTGEKISGPVILRSLERTIGPYPSATAGICGNASDSERLTT